MKTLLTILILGLATIALGNDYLIGNSNEPEEHPDGDRPIIGECSEEADIQVDEDVIADGCSPMLLDDKICFCLESVEISVYVCEDGFLPTNPTVIIDDLRGRVKNCPDPLQLQQMTTIQGLNGNQIATWTALNRHNGARDFLDLTKVYFIDPHGEEPTKIFIPQMTALVDTETPQQRLEKLREETSE